MILTHHILAMEHLIG